METYFENIKEKVLEELDSAEFVIYAAVAWVTDYKIIEKLVYKLQQGVKVELIINDDDRFERRLRQFNDFHENGGNLYLYRTNDNSLMHNKFCVIDLVTTITGSFNWSFAASTKHKENIVIARNNIDFSKGFAREFASIKRDSIIYEGNRVPFDSANYATINQVVSISNNGDEEYFQIHLSQGAKFGIIECSMDILLSPFKMPDKVYGYWTKPWDPNKEVKGLEHAYHFKVLDPVLIKFVK